MILIDNLLQIVENETGIANESVKFSVSMEKILL